VRQEPVSVNEVVKRALSLVKEQLRTRQIVVELKLCPDSPVVIANAIQLEQAFINLLSNAWDAVAGSPRKVIAISSSLHSDHVEIVFADTGPGIPPGLEERIFDPFFTTKEVGAGTGLGLSITYGIIKGHEGAISVVNRPGEGATFLIRLPLTRERNSENPML
jgi:C4-dicarboxylate-specific signal transduction histidine kinase